MTSRFEFGVHARPNPRVALRAAAALACVAVLGGCTTVRGWFSSDDDEPNEPVALKDFAPSAAVAQLWSANVGKGEGRLGARQAPAVADGRVYAAAVEGGVHALDLQTGRVLWHYKTELPLAGGPAVGDGLVVVGGLDGTVIALDASTGTEKWRSKLKAEIISAPSIGLGSVFVRSNDGRVTAFDASNGERRWFWNRDTPTLSLRGTSSPVLGPGFVFIGNDDGTVAALSAEDGRPLWELPVAQPEGRTELDRMSDVDGTPVLDGATLVATSFKNRTIAVDAPTGRPMWSSDNGGPGRVAVGSDRVVVTAPTGIVFGLDKAGGSALWQQPGLARRGVTSPAIHGDYAVVGDQDGYLHWLKLDNGEFAARARAGRDALRAPPVVADGIAVVQNVDGKVIAFRLNP
ncbi:outer membrane protein assembly factor BamB [Cognatilysobacter bugurensis]|uniref:Outer membrane protein assembly factor BamB n=1 Tax=Cognatilysobacter bugurensis TaxID=543356 RepID=A0A918SW69_9GAMM|nr:outer membrane protein assembly factor BamB [Lysobacter bugurensis]GHA74162.1 outer membrane protein assembly factor BamB [Lysobacter bugurensis]